MKRALSIVLIVAMLIGLIPLSTVVASETSNTIISVDDVSAIIDSTVDVTVNISGNPGIASMGFTMTFDEDLTLIGATNGEAFSEMTFTAPAQLKKGGSVTGTCRFAWLGNENVTENGTILNLKFKVAENAELNKECLIVIDCDNGDVLDDKRVPVDVTATNGKVTIIDYIPGDIDGSGTINMLDVLTLCQFYVDGCQYDPNGYGINIRSECGDVDANGKVNMLDVLMICQYYVDGCKYDPNGYAVKLLPGKAPCDHLLKKTDEVAPTCTEDGNIAYWYCEKCKEYYSDENATNVVSLESTIVKAKGHTVVVDEAVAPTYEKTGLTEGTHCSLCNTVLKAQEVVPKLQRVEYAITYHVANNDNYLQTLEINNPNLLTYTSEDGLELQDLIVDGYEFKGWYTAQTGGVRVTDIPKGTTGNKTLYAQWNKVEYIVTFDSPDVPVSNITYTVDRGVTLTNPTWFGYTFVGWSKDGRIISSITPGTTGHMTLHANWTSNRNKAKAVSELGSPSIIEDLDNGQYLFVYEIGTLENVPLIDGTEKVINSEGINITEEITLKKAVNRSTADKIAKSVSNATTKTSSWTLSEDWNKTTSATNEHDEQIGKTQERTDSEGNVLASQYYVSNSKGGSTSVSSSSGGSSSNSSKVTLGASTGINSSYGTERQTETSVNSTVSNTKSKEFDWNIGGNYGQNKNASAGVGINGLSAGLSAGSSWGINGGIGGKKTDSTTNSVGISVDNSIKNSANISNSRNYNVGTENSSSSEGHWDTSSSSSSNWNSTSGYESSKEISKNTTISNAISQVVNDKYSYTSTDSVGGSNSETCSTGESQELTDEYASTVEYSTEEDSSESQTVSYKSSATGYYRVITAGTLHVFAVVGYDIATNSYYTYTYNVLDKERHSYLDYSKDNANFNDCENGILPFEIPYDVHDYISVKIGKSSGLRVSESTGMVTAYTGTADYVVIPEYVSVTDGLNKAKAVRVSGFTQSAFAGNTNIKGVILPKHIQAIPANAFEGCTNLETVIGYGVNDIGTEAFKNCMSLQSFIIDEFVQNLGAKAFENTAELYVNAANVSVAEAALDSGTTHLILCLSEMEGTFENKKIIIPDTTKFFALLSDGEAYKNLSFESNADETFLSNFRLIENTDTPLKINSDRITLSKVFVENSPGFALITLKDNVTLKLYGDIELSSKEENAVITKNINIGLLNDEVDAVLNVTGNYLINGYITNEQKLNISYNNGKLIHITDEQFNDYLTSSIVNFDANEGQTDVYNKTVYYGQSYGELPQATRDNYTFAGWYTEKDAGTLVTADSTVTALVNQTLYAHWIPNKFTVTFNANDGTVSTPSKCLTYGDSIGTMPTPIRDYYTFDGWYTQENGGEKVAESTVYSVASDVTLYAHWNSNPASSWVKASEMPEDAKVVSRKYSYTLRSYTTNASGSLSGWTKYNTVRTGWGSTQGPVGFDPSNGARNVWSEQYETGRTHHWVYYRYANSTGSSGSDLQSATYKNYEEINLTYQLTDAGSMGNNSRGVKYYYNGSNYRTYWYLREYDDISYGTRWYYQEPIYTYYYYKDENKETTIDPSGTSNVSNVVEWVQYISK